MKELVSVVIVNYNSGDLLILSLGSLMKQTYPRIEIIVIDNASSDGSISIAEAFDNINVIHNRKNIGFAAAQNQGMLIAQGQFLMPLNFDVDLDTSFIEEMVNSIESSEKIGWACGKHLGMTEKGIHLNTFYSTGHKLPANRFPRHRGAGEINAGQYDTPGVVFGAPGVAPLYKRVMLEDIAYQGQFFDQVYFTWFEDVELDWRANLCGWQCLYTPTAILYHIGSDSGNRSDIHLSINIRNRWLMVATDEDLVCMFRNFLSLVLYEISLLQFIIVHKRFRAYFMAVVGFLRELNYVVHKRFWLKKKKKVKGSEIPFDSEILVVEQR